jgi:hypothetical protein
MFSLDSQSGPLIYTGLIALYGLYLWQQRRTRRRSLPLPPGPKGLPLIGNFYDIPAAFEWEQYARWSDEYSKLTPLITLLRLISSPVDSDIIYLNVAGNSIVIVNSHKVATDLFDKRSSRYSSRCAVCCATRNGNPANLRFVIVTQANVYHDQ